MPWKNELFVILTWREGNDNYSTYFIVVSKNISLLSIIDSLIIVKRLEIDDSHLAFYPEKLSPAPETVIQPPVPASMDVDVVPPVQVRIPPQTGLYIYF